MSSKKKLVITLSSLCAVVVVAVLTVALVFAFGNATLKSNITTKYTADKAVKGTVTAVYTVKNEDETALHEVVTLTGEEETPTIEKSASKNITLTRDNNEVVFKYSFTADTSTDATKNGYTATLKFTATENKNVKIEVSTDGTTYSEKTDMSSLGSVSVTSSTAVSYYVRVSISSKLNDAEFSGAFEWVLTPIAG